MDVEEIAPGLWRWGGEGETASYYAEGPETVVLFDPLVPADEEERFWRALDRDVRRRGHPVLVCVTAGDHRERGGGHPRALRRGPRRPPRFAG